MYIFLLMYTSSGRSKGQKYIHFAPYLKELIIFFGRCIEPQHWHVQVGLGWQPESIDLCVPLRNFSGLSPLTCTCCLCLYLMSYYFYTGEQEFILVLLQFNKQNPQKAVCNELYCNECCFLRTQEKGCAINSYFHKSSFHFCFLPYDMLSSILIIPVRLTSATDDDQ